MGPGQSEAVRTPMPNDADLLDLMLDWVPDEMTRRRIFVDNPSELFGTKPNP
jgi:predicted TIM-barrel fold metal-dependent hydrolase